jgi:hypothetical protein
MRATRRHIPEEDTLQNHRCENLKSYVLQEVLTSLVDLIVSTLVLFSFLYIRKKVDLMRCPSYLCVPFNF